MRHKIQKWIILKLIIACCLLDKSVGQVCGDCVLDWPTETCDDCNLIDGDGY